MVYHVLNRGNARQTTFHTDADYQQFLHFLGQARERFSVEVFSFCLMPNHFHLLMAPARGKDMSKMLHWLEGRYARHHHRLRSQTGHLWQGRFRSFAVQADRHFLAVARYVESNPLLAQLAATASSWPWSSYQLAAGSFRASLVSKWPVPKPEDWAELVHLPLHEKEVEAIQYSINRQAPFGDHEWRFETAIRMGLEMTVRPRRNRSLLS